MAEVAKSDEAQQAFYDALLDDDPERLYERAPCGYLSTTPDGTILKVNETFLTLTGLSRGELVGRRTFAELLTGGGRIYHETHYAPLLRMHDSVGEIALDIVKEDGQRLPVLVNAALERDRAGTPVVIRIAVFDATSRREYERELLRAKQRAESSESEATELAQTLQRTLIPPVPPDIPGLDVAAVYRAAGTGGEVGGDFYDVFQIADGQWLVVLGDMRGKGVDAAVVTAFVRHHVRAFAVRMAQPSMMLHALNQVLLAHETDRFCTIVIARLHKSEDGWTVTLGMGGHPLPLVSREGRPPTPVGEPGSLVGALEVTTFSDARLRLGPGDSLLLYTDGVTEGRRGRGRFFGEERLARAVRAHAGSAQQTVDGVLAEVLEFQAGLASDDIAMVAVQVPDQ